MAQQGESSTGLPQLDVADTEEWSLSMPLRVLLAACSAGAACIHFAMVPAHASEWLAEGIAFALVGWFQVAFAVLVLMRPSALLLRAAVVANTAFVIAWAWTRTVGPPAGPEAGVAHDAGFVDLACVALEAVIVVAGVVALVRPRLGERAPRFGYATAVVVPLVVLGLATAAIASPSASGHGHDGAGGHSHDEAAAHDDGAAHADGDDHHGAVDPNFDDKGLSLLTAHNGEHPNWGPDEALDAKTRAVLKHQLELTRPVVDALPTLGDAKAAGSQPAGAFIPGSGIHMSVPPGAMPDAPPPDPSVPTIPGVLTDEQLMHPTNLLYGGITDDAPLVGLMYYSMGMGEPVGFAGPNDHWHSHGSLCVKMGEGGKITVLHPDELTPASCEALTGMFIERTQSMVHVWTVPGYESNQGVFSDINPAITCPDGTYYTVPPEETEQYKLNKCRSNPE